MTDDPSPYERLGGEAAIETLIDALYERVMADPELAPFFESSSLERIRSMQRELFSQALGGPLIYEGKPLREVHHGRGIKMTHFQRYVQHMLDTLAALDLTPAEADAVIDRLNVDADQIVGQSNVDG